MGTGSSDPAAEDDDTAPPLADTLPSPTHSNEVDLQLGAPIAIIIKELVYCWYANLILDNDFVGELVRLIAHRTRALEGRLRPRLGNGRFQQAAGTDARG